MKLRRLLALGALLSLLLGAHIPVVAEEARFNALQTALSSTTISGYVDTSVEWSLGEKPTRRVGWWQSFRIWLTTHGWQ